MGGNSSKPEEKLPEGGGNRPIDKSVERVKREASQSQRNPAEVQLLQARADNIRRRARKADDTINKNLRFKNQNEARQAQRSNWYWAPDLDVILLHLWRVYIDDTVVELEAIADAMAGGPQAVFENRIGFKKTARARGFSMR